LAINANGLNPGNPRSILHFYNEPVLISADSEFLISELNQARLMTQWEIAFFPLSLAALGW
jgi:hypothetical protein